MKVEPCSYERVDGNEETCRTQTENWNAHSSSFMSCWQDLNVPTLFFVLIVLTNQTDMQTSIIIPFSHFQSLPLILQDLSLFTGLLS